MQMQIQIRVLELEFGGVFVCLNLCTLKLMVSRLLVPVEIATAGHLLPGLGHQSQLQLQHWEYQPQLKSNLTSEKLCID